MNIAQIKKKLSVGEYGYHKDGLYGDSCEDADKDIEYLLSIIEQTEEALRDISFITRYSDNIVHMSVHNLAVVALKAMQGDEMNKQVTGKEWRDFIHALPEYEFEPQPIAERVSIKVNGKEVAYKDFDGFWIRTNE